MRTVNVKLNTHSYPIYIGADLLKHDVLWRPHIKGRQVMLVTSKSIALYYAHLVKDKLKDYQCNVIVLPDGEEYKNLETVSRIWDELVEYNHHRTTTLIALGGGVIGDMVGFAAACYQRGVHFIQMPTTLLAQVDAAIGGKTAVNHAKAKNMIGAFYQPNCVVIDINTLSTLSRRHFRAGFAEVIKYGLINDSDFFHWLVKNSSALMAHEANVLEYAIERSCVIKAMIVSYDEKEQSGLRALLNLGHTFAHAIETIMGYDTWLHGEAVAVGMLMAADLSARIGYIHIHDVEQLKQLLIAFDLPVLPPQTLLCDAFLQIMRRDKKALDSGLQFVLLRQLGKAELVAHVPQELLMQTLSAFGLKE